MELPDMSGKAVSAKINNQNKWTKVKQISKRQSKVGQISEVDKKLKTTKDKKQNYSQGMTVHGLAKILNAKNTVEKVAWTVFISSGIILAGGAGGSAAASGLLGNRSLLLEPTASSSLRCACPSLAVSSANLCAARSTRR